MRISNYVNSVVSMKKPQAVQHGLRQLSQVGITEAIFPERRHLRGLPDQVIAQQFEDDAGPIIKSIKRLADVDCHRCCVRAADIT